MRYPLAPLGLLFVVSAEVCTKTPVADHQTWNLYKKSNVVNVTIYQCIQNKTLTECGYNRFSCKDIFEEQLVPRCRKLLNEISSTTKPLNERSTSHAINERCRSCDNMTGTVHILQSTTMAVDMFDDDIELFGTAWSYKSGGYYNASHVYVWDVEQNFTLSANDTCQNVSLIDTSSFTKSLWNTSSSYLILEREGDSYAIEITEKTACGYLATDYRGIVVASYAVARGKPKYPFPKKLSQYWTNHKYNFERLSQTCQVSELKAELFSVWCVVVAITCYVVLHAIFLLYNSMANWATFRRAGNLVQGNINRFLLELTRAPIGTSGEGKNREHNYEYITSDYNINELYKRRERAEDSHD